MILLWTDAGPDVGLGHVSRGLALAAELARRGAPCRFALPADPTALEWLLAAGHTDPIVLAPDAPALPQVLAAADGTAAVIADLRAPIDRATVRALGRGRTVVVVDNAGPGVADADLIVAPFGTARDARWLAGPAHMPLRQARTASFSRLRAPGDLPVVLLSMGGSDPGGLTRSAVEALGAVTTPRLRAHVIANPRTPVWASLPGVLGRLGFPPARPIVPGAMAAHLAAADVAVLALGVTVYEALAAGVPSIVLSRTPADVAHAESLAASGAIVSLGIDPSPADVATAVGALLRDPELRTAMGRAGRALVDGQGAARIVGRLLAVMGEKEGSDARRLEA